MDATSCGAISQGFLNTFRKHPDHFNALAKDVALMAEGKNIPRLPKRDTGNKAGSLRAYWEPEDAFRLLPSHAFKNAQSRAFIRKYLEHNPEAAATVVSSRNETIVDRLKRLSDKDDPLKDADRADMVRGTDKKSIHMMRSAMEYLTPPGWRTKARAWFSSWRNGT
jgi:hypothetical protein